VKSSELSNLDSETIVTHQILDLVKRGTPTYEIADAVGVPRGKITQVLRELRELVTEETQSLATSVFMATDARLNDLYSHMRAIVVNPTFDNNGRIRAAAVCVQIQKGLTDLHKVGRASNTTNVLAHFGSMSDHEIERALKQISEGQD
jgi:hypothetical protein